MAGSESPGLGGMDRGVGGGKLGRNMKEWIGEIKDSLKKKIYLLGCSGALQWHMGSSVVVHKFLVVDSCGI